MPEVKSVFREVLPKQGMLHLLCNINNNNNHLQSYCLLNPSCIQHAIISKDKMSLFVCRPAVSGGRPSADPL